MGLKLGNQYDCQVTEKGFDISLFDPGEPRVVFLSKAGVKPSDKGKPGESRGRKVTGLPPPISGNDRRTSEMGYNSCSEAHT
jgi:hypothetical protein